MAVGYVVFDMPISREKCASAYQHQSVPLEIVWFERRKIEPLLILSNPFDASLHQSLLRTSICGSARGSVWEILGRRIRHRRNGEAQTGKIKRRYGTSRCQI